ncbi:MAG: hypothetical protein K8R54_15785 [Bacteroidales bacterium]|nr:hypothetical protein [Bacteroidales bacterium]
MENKSNKPAVEKPGISDLVFIVIIFSGNILLLSLLIRVITDGNFNKFSTLIIFIILLVFWLITLIGFFDKIKQFKKEREIYSEFINSAEITQARITEKKTETVIVEGIDFPGSIIKTFILTFEINNNRFTQRVSRRTYKRYNEGDIIIVKYNESRACII